MSVCANAWLTRLGADVQRILFRPRRSAIDVRVRRSSLTTAPLRYAHFLRVQRVQNMAFDYCSEGLWECLSFKDYMADLMGDEM